MFNSKKNGDMWNIPYKVVDPETLIDQYKKGKRNFPNSDLQYANLKEIDLEGINLAGSFIESAVLSGANLKNANLERVSLRGSDLSEAILTKASLKKAQLNPIQKFLYINSASMKNGTITRGLICEATVDGKVLSGEDLKKLPSLIERKIKNVKIEKVDFQDIQLTDIELDDTEQNYNMVSTNLSGAILQNVNFANANLTKANLECAILTDANLTAANLSGTNLEKSELSGITYNASKGKFRGIRLESAYGHTVFKNDAIVQDYIETIQLNDKKNDYVSSIKKSESINEHLSELPETKDYYTPKQKEDEFIIKTSNQLIDEYHSNERDFKKIKIKNANLNGVDLKGIIFDNAILIGASFEGANLENASFIGADIRGANFKGAVLKNVNLTKAKLESVNLSGIEIKTAKLKGTNIIQNAIIDQIEYDSIKLSGSKLNSDKVLNSRIDKANFKRISFREIKFDKLDIIENNHNENNAITNLEGALLDNAILDSTNFTEANMEGCSLKNAKLANTKFYKTNLKECNLQKAEIKGVDFRLADFSESQVEGIDILNHKEWFKFWHYDESKYRGIKNITKSYGNSVFKEYARDQDFLETFRKKNCINSIVHYIWFISSNCGRSLTRFFICAFIVALIFGFAFHKFDEDFCVSDTTCIGSDSDSPKRKVTFITPIYYSIVTFTTLGFGDVTPRTPFGEKLIIAEVLIGYIMLGLLLSILTNKFARRDR